MRSDSRNPANNALPPGINEKELIAAVEASGYPLQGIVASKLPPSFSVAEEWGYIDDASKEHRSLDVFAHKQLSGDANTNPALVLLIECKRSRHPFIFFKRVIDRAAVRFPYIAGLLTFGASSPLMKSKAYGNREIRLLQNFLEFLLSREKPLLLSR